MKNYTITKGNKYLVRDLYGRESKIKVVSYVNNHKNGYTGRAYFVEDLDTGEQYTIGTPRRFIRELEDEA